MLKYPELTPCPVLASDPLESSTSQQYEPTEEVNFTTEIQAALRQAAPRRRNSIRLREKQGLLIAQSAAAGSDASAIKTQTTNHYDRVDSQPAFPQPQTTDHRQLPARRRTSKLPSKWCSDTVYPKIFPRNAEGASNGDASHPGKKPRRRTIYVPSDDTTILTIHPGSQTDTRTLSDCSFSAMGHSDLKELGAPLQGKPQQQVNRKALGAAPKRAPLQPTLKPLQEIDDHSDIPGAGPGKENLPPSVSVTSNVKRHTVAGSKAKRVSIFASIPGVNTAQSEHLFSMDKASTMEKSRANGEAKRASIAGGPKRVTYFSEEPIAKRKTRELMMNRRNTLYYGSTWKTPADACHNEPTARLPSKVAGPVINKANRGPKIMYSILAEDINRPEMFEDAWLGDQESAIQQLVNGLFEASSPGSPDQCSSPTKHRQSLLQLYQTSECSLLYKRLQASLLYGALSPPEGSIAETSRLKSDIGLRQNFLAIWIGTYEQAILSAAAEIVIGRELPLPASTTSLGHQHTYTTKDRKRDLEGFITSCLLQNEDTSESEQLSPTFCWRRTVLRSLMLVLLLDKASSAKLVAGNLFRTSSNSKTSRSVLTELSALLLPFIGDVCRPLSHLDYHVHHSQFPLSEFQYNIDNLATDLRDGIRLTRLVELLLYPPQTLSSLADNVTIAMPTGEVLTSLIEEGQSWVLSQHLKFPCVGRAQRVYNVQIALSALRGIGGVGEIAQCLHAEDIVNGHRERTVVLLWGLVGKWGLERLVDFEVLSKEVKRLRRLYCDSSDKDYGFNETDDQYLEGLEKHTYLLKSWANIIALRYGLPVHNLTTSFADGKVFGKIVDEYRPFLPQSKASLSYKAYKPSHLHVKLKDIGCSASFASIFEDNRRGRVFHRDFTLAALAFLFSRLLGASRRGRAAAVIQRAYRHAKMRESMRQRCTLLTIAHKCKDVFNTRDRVVGAARVLQRAWRNYLKERKAVRTMSAKRSERGIEAARAKGLWGLGEDSVDIWLS